MRKKRRICYIDVITTTGRAKMMTKDEKTLADLLAQNARSAAKHERRVKEIERREAVEQAAWIARCNEIKLRMRSM